MASSISKKYKINSSMDSQYGKNIKKRFNILFIILVLPFIFDCGGGSSGSIHNGSTEIQPPTNVTASGGMSSTQVDITWNSVDNAYSYNVYRSESEEGAYDAIGNTSDLSFADSTAIADIHYWYKVSTVDDLSNESKLSLADEGWIISSSAECGNGTCETDESSDSCPRDCLIEKIGLLKNYSIHGSFSPNNSRIVIDKANPDLFYDVYVIDFNGNIISSLTEGNPLVSQRGNSWPAWHPSGDYIVFQSEEEPHWGMDNLWYSHPGLGFFHNLYAISIDGQQIWKLTDIPIKQDLYDSIPVYASLNPVFNRDGSKLMWTERYSEGGDDFNWGNWRIKMADFIIGTDGPSLQNIEIVLEPPSFCGNSNCQYANGMAFIDDTTILVAGDLSEQHVYGMDQYTYNLQTKVLNNLLDTPLYWEEGSCYLDGKIVYQTNQGSDYSLDFNDSDWGGQPRTREYWIMNADGSNKKQLTYFNTPGSPEYVEFGKGRRTIVAECEFSSDGKNMLGVIGFDNGNADTVEMTLQVFLFQLNKP